MAAPVGPILMIVRRIARLVLRQQRRSGRGPRY